jgi:hypothetical protein
MARIPDATVSALQECFKDFGLTVSSITARETVAAVRQLVSDGAVSTAVEQQSLLLRSLVPLKQLCLESNHVLALSWDSDE